MADEVHNPPTEFPRPTDQGDSGLCTRHAIGNTIASEGMKHKVDFNLDTAITALVQFESDRNVHIGINPTDFHKKVVVIQDQKSKAWYHVHLSVERCNTAQCQAGIGKHQFVVVYPPNPGQGGTHCVYVQNIEKTRSGDCFRCINSWGTHEETPLININSQRIEIYKVMIQLTVNKSQGVSKSTDISALSMKLDERLHITGVIYLKKKSDYEKFKALHATKRLSCDADIPIHCPVSNHNDLSNLILIPTGFTNVIVEGDVHLQTASNYSDIVKYSCHAAVHCHINAIQDISNLSTLAGMKGRYNAIVKVNLMLQKRVDYDTLKRIYSASTFTWEGTVVCQVLNPGDISHLAILPVFQGTKLYAIVKGDLHLQTKKEYDDLLACYSTNMFSWEVKILCHLQNIGDIAHLAILLNFTGTNCSVAIKGHVHLTLKNDYDTLIKLHSTFSITINAIITCGSDNISTNIGEVSQLLPLLTTATKLVIKGDIRCAHKKDYDMMIKLHSTYSVTINAIVTCGSDNISINIGEVFQLLPLLTKATKLIITGNISWTHNKDYDMLIKLHSACSVTINAIVTFGIDKNSTNLREVAQLMPIVAKATQLVIKGFQLELRSPGDAQVFRQLSTTCRLTYSLQMLYLYCDVSGGEVDWLAELVSAVPSVWLFTDVKLTDNICGAVARRLEQPGAKLQNLWLRCNMSLVSGAALADVWAKVSEVNLWIKLTEAQAVGVAGRLEGRDARLELLVLGWNTDVSGVSGRAMANLIRRVSRVTTSSGISMTKTNVREMMGRLKQIGLSVDTGRLKMDGWGGKVKLKIYKDTTGVKLSEY